MKSVPRRWEQINHLTAAAGADVFDGQMFSAVRPRVAQPGRAFGAAEPVPVSPPSNGGLIETGLAALDDGSVVIGLRSSWTMARRDGLRSPCPGRREVRDL